MNKDKGPITFLKNLITKDGQQDQKKNKFSYLFLVLLFGVAIMLISNMFFGGEDRNANMSVMNNTSDEKESVETFGQKNNAANQEITDYEAIYKEQIKEAVDQIAGVKDATVVVNVDATEKKVYEKNTTTQSQTTEETDPEGGERTVKDASTEQQLVIIKNGDKEVPVTVETKKPAIRGVLIVAKGAENIQIKKTIIEAVTRALDVPSHRVSVVPKQS